jgi:hypothetical protein
LDIPTICDIKCFHEQEELLGLADLEESAALARQVDASVLFREGETSRVPPFGLNTPELQGRLTSIILQ